MSGANLAIKRAFCRTVEHRTLAIAPRSVRSSVRCGRRQRWQQRLLFRASPVTLKGLGSGWGDCGEFGRHTPTSARSRGCAERWSRCALFRQICLRMEQPESAGAPARVARGAGGVARRRRARGLPNCTAERVGETSRRRNGGDRIFETSARNARPTGRPGCPLF